jgi:hypothetical protein
MQMNGIKESKKRCDPTLCDFTIHNADPPFTRNASSSPVMTFVHEDPKHVTAIILFTLVDKDDCFWVMPNGNSAVLHYTLSASMNVR